MEANTTSSNNTNRIPLRVNHGEVPSPSAYTSSRTFTRSATDQNNNNAYDMRGMYDETDRIKTRMREFEERCKRWREDFFNKTNTLNSPSLFDRGDFPNEPRVPPPSFVNSDHHFSNPSFSSGTTMHKSYLEDQPDGTKKYKIEFDIGDFRQNEILITTNGRSLILKGDRELKAGSATETKTFNRELTLPDYVDFDKMNAYLLENENNNTSQTNNNVLVIEAPVVMDKYAYRRSVYDQTASSASRPQTATRRAQFTSPDYHGTTQSQPPPQQRNTSRSTTTLMNPNYGVGEAHHHSSESKTTQSHSSTSKSTTSRVIHNGTGSQPHLVEESSYSTSNRYPPHLHQDNLINSSPIKSSYTSPSHLNLNSNQYTLSPELIPGYPVYDNVESCVVYKFDLNGFDQSEIHLTITVDRTLEIKACKELTDHLGKIYREFKREIQLEPEVDANQIKNLLHEGILTLKIPKPNRPDGLGSVSNNHNLHGPNGFREIYTDDGKLAKITTDFRGYNPENLKIVLSANNVLKITAQQVETSSNTKGTVQKECTRQYALPSWIQPEQMKAVMSRDGLLTVDFTNNSSSKNNHDERININ